MSGVEAAHVSRARRQATPQELFVLFVPAIAMFTITVFGERLVIDGDLFWHLAAGEWMIDRGAIIRSDTFSYTFAGQPWHAHEWLSEILMAATYRWAGWNGLYVLTALAFGATAVLLSRHLLVHLEPLPALVLTLFALACLKGWIMMRPHVLVLPILATWIAELLAARRHNRAPRWFLMPLMVLWANLHASFPLGAALIAVFGLEALLDTPRERARVAARWGARFAGAILATLLNPAGVAGAIFPILFTATGSAAMILEWRSTTFDTIGPFEISLLAGAFTCLLLGVRVGIVRVMLLAGMLHLALAHQRFVVVLAVVGAMILAEPFANALRARRWTTASHADTGVNKLTVSAGAALITLAIAAASFTLPRELRNEPITPVEALSRVPAAIADKPVFNDWVMGGYLIFTGLRPYIDTRAELYGADFIRNYMRMVEPDAVGLKDAFARHGVMWTLLPPGSRANAALDLMPDWCRLYQDGAAIVHVHKDALTGNNARCLP